MKTKKTAEFKERELERHEAREKGVGRGAGKIPDEGKPAPGGGRG